MDAWKVQAHLAGSMGLVIFNFVVDTRIYMSFRPDAWKSPVFFAAILERNSFIGVFVHAACYVTVVSVHVVLPLLRRTVQLFQDAVKSMDDVKLEVSRTKSVDILNDRWKTLTQCLNSAGSHPQS